MAARFLAGKKPCHRSWFVACVAMAYAWMVTETREQCRINVVPGRVCGRAQAVNAVVSTKPLNPTSRQ